MKRLFIVFVLLAAALLTVTGCVAGKGDGAVSEEPGSPARGDLQMIYVQEAQATAVAAPGQETVLNVSGNLPSPAYKLERVDIKVTGNVVELTPLASYDRKKMAAQVLVPFSDTVKVKLPKAGVYTVRVVGKGENRESKITVKDE